MDNLPSWISRTPNNIYYVIEFDSCSSGQHLWSFLSTEVQGFFLHEDLLVVLLNKFNAAQWLTAYGLRMISKSSQKMYHHNLDGLHTLKRFQNGNHMPFKLLLWGQSTPLEWHLFCSSELNLNSFISIINLRLWLFEKYMIIEYSKTCVKKSENNICGDFYCYL